ncbi:MAG: hypothetical protein Q7S64_01065 [bacterium]|nr:hypothetical protein [bacterium]
MKQRGSAIIIAMIVVSIIGVVGFGVSRLAIMQLRLANINDAAIRAHAAAEAGLEYALYQNSINPNATISSAAVDSQVVPAQPGQPGLNDTPLTFTLPGPNSDQSFSVLMSHETYRAGNQACFTNQIATDSMDATTGGCQDSATPLVVLQPDESFTFTKPTAAELYVRAEPATLPPTIPGQEIKYGAVEINGFDNAPSPTLIAHQVVNLGSIERKLIMQFDDKGFNLSQANPRFSDAARITIRYYKTNQSGPDYGPLSVAIQMKDKSTDQLVPFDGGITTIDVIGKVPGHERRLKAQIDRRTNQVIGIFDYALYAQDKLTAP